MTINHKGGKKSREEHLKKKNALLHIHIFTLIKKLLLQFPDLIKKTVPVIVTIGLLMTSEEERKLEGVFSWLKIH